MFELGGDYMDLKTITLRMPYDLHRNLKVKMAQEDKTMQNQILELIAEYLEREESKQLNQDNLVVDKTIKLGLEG